MKVVFACLRIIAECQYDGHALQFWAMENPVGLLRRFMGKPAITFEHWQFDPEATHCKPTDIWGRFNEPKWAVTTKPDLHRNRNHRVGNWQSPPVPKGFEHLNLDRAAIRAITPQGFAQAFFKANC